MEIKEIREMLKKADKEIMDFAKIAGQPRNKLESKMLDSFVRSRMMMEKMFSANPGKVESKTALAVIDNSYITREKIIRDRYCTFLGAMYIGIATIATVMLTSVCLAALLLL